MKIKPNWANNKTYLYAFYKTHIKITPWKFNNKVLEKDKSGKCYVLFPNPSPSKENSITMLISGIIKFNGVEH